MPTREEIMRKYNPDWRPEEGSAQPAPNKAEEIKQRYAKSWGEGVSSPRSVPKEATQEEAPPVDMSGGTLDFATPFGTVKTPIPLPASIAKGFAQVGSGIADYDLGFRQLIGKASKQDAADKRRLDKPLTEGVVGTLNQFMGKALPTMLIPYGWASKAGSVAGPLIENVAGNVAVGALEPVAPGESRAMNMGVAGAAGAIPSGLTALARRSVQLEDDAARLAASAQNKWGIPLSPADVTENRLVKAFRSVADDSMIPGVSSRGLREEQQQAFNRAMGSAWGSKATKHTPDVRAADKDRIVKALNNAWDNNNLPYDANMFGALRQLEANAEKFPGQTRDTILRHIEDLESRVIADPSGNLYIPGPVANEFQKDLFKNFGNKGRPDALDNQMMDLRGTILNHFNSNLTGAEAKALNEARGQYRAFKAMEPTLQKGDVGTRGRFEGDIDPLLVSEAVRSNYKSNPAGSPFGDLPQIGQRFLVDRTAQTGGSPRALVQNSLLGSGLTLGGLGAAGVPLALPALGGLAGLVAAGGATARAINSPKLLRALQADPYAIDRPIAKQLARASAARLPGVAAVGALSALTATPEEVSEPAGGEEEEE